jgi:hypothetical protein
MSSGGADIKKYEYLDACRGYAILLVIDGARRSAATRRAIARRP